MEKDAEKEAIMELKQEVQRVRILLMEEESDEDDDLELRFTESAIHTLRALKELKVKQSDGGLIMLKNLGIQHPPQEFLCPISGLLIISPIVSESGQTNDVTSIRKWMREGNTKCPRTGEEVCHAFFTPNDLLKKLILNWCKKSQISFFQEKGEEMEKMTVLELKKELQRVIEDDDDDNDDLGLVDDAVQTLYGLRELKLKQEPPKEFLCPLSGILMADPVVAASGETFDEAQFQKGVKQGKAKILDTDNPFPHTLLIPNHLIKVMIAKWCKAIHLRPPPCRLSNDEHLIADPSLLHLFKRFSSLSHSHQTATLRDIRLLTARLPSFRTLFGNISPLLTPFMIDQYKSDAALYKDAVAMILNVSIDDVNKAKMVNDDCTPIPFLIDALKGHNSTEISGYAAAALSELSTVDSNKLVIGESGAVRLLIELLELGHPLASRDAASAISRLCTRIENQERVLSEGGLVAVMNKLGDHTLLDQMLEILASFSSHPGAIEVMWKGGVMPRLFSIIVETRSKRDEENCVVVICAVACSDRARTRLREVEKVENALKILFGLTNNGTARAGRKVDELLLRIRGKELANVRTRY